jgi:hypothetical protein
MSQVKIPSIKLYSAFFVSYSTLTPQAEFNEPNGNIKTESRPEDCLFEICGGPVSGGAMEEEYTMISFVYRTCCLAKQTHNMKGT